MAQAPKCKVCGDRYWGLCTHKKLVTNKPKVRLTDATNITESATNAVCLEPEVHVGEEANSETGKASVQRTSNRRSREA